VADPETARLVRHVPGSLLFVLKEGDAKRRLLVTPGRRVADLDKAACTIECRMADFVAAEAGGVSPMQLFTSGKLRISGNLQIAMALAGVLA
jgi:putative sterol carrier protein